MTSKGFRAFPNLLRPHLYQPKPTARAFILKPCQTITRRASHQPHHHTTSSPQHWLEGLQKKQGLLEASYSSIALLVVLACGSAVLIQYLIPTQTGAPPSPSGSQLPTAPSPLPTDSPYYTDMPIEPGHLGNLTLEQDAKLRELWAATLKTFGVVDPNRPVDSPTTHLKLPDSANDTDSISSDKGDKRRKSRLSIFGKKHDEKPSSATASPTRDKHTGDSAEEDKYGQVKEYQQIVATQTPESLRETFWAMVKADHPDALLLRFLRARKWDVDRALVMLISTMNWRNKEMHVDDDVIKHGEGGALEDSKGSDKFAKQEGEDFLAQLRLGKSFLHGTDKEGRPLCFVRARLHHGGDQSERSMERYTVYVIETARLVLRTPVETACIVFDMSHFTMANMDYAPVKFMIKVFEANYPESLGAVLVHKAPWLFNAIWKIIKGWLDPVVASKVHFTSDIQELEKYISKSQIIKELGGDEDWEYHFVEPVAGENDLMKEEAPRIKLQEERKQDVLAYQQKTFEWIAGAGAEVRKERDELAHKMNINYWHLDPYIRARTLYDRISMIEQGGKISFYPSRPTVNGSKAEVPARAAHADDVD